MKPLHPEDGVVCPLTKDGSWKNPHWNLTNRVHKEKKPLAPLAYLDGQMIMPVLSLLLPHLTVDSYNPATGRLDLTVDSPWIMNKIQAIQTSLINAASLNQQSWFGSHAFTVCGH
jgi:hypothetical protein